jgi:hypothetical protein
MLGSSLLRLPWEGPLCRATWLQVTLGMCEDDFKLLVVTRHEQMVPWQKSEAYAQVIKVISQGLSIRAMWQFGAPLLDKLLAPRTRGRPQR